MQQRHSWEHNSSPACKEMSSNLWNPKVHYHFHDSSPMAPILGQINTIYTLPSYFLKMHINIILSYVYIFQVTSFPQASPPKPCMHLSTPLYMPHVLTDLIAWITFSEGCGSCSSLCSLLQSPVTTSLLGPNIFLSTLLSNTLSLGSSFNVKDHVSHAYKTTQKL
jgi:hypothetical protein